MRRSMAPNAGAELVIPGSAVYAPAYILVDPLYDVPLGHRVAEIGSDITNASSRLSE